MVCLPQPDAEGRGHTGCVLQGNVYIGDGRPGEPPALSRRDRYPHRLCARQPASGHRGPPASLRRTDFGRAAGWLRVARDLARLAAPDADRRPATRRRDGQHLHPQTGCRHRPYPSDIAHRRPTARQRHRRADLAPRPAPPAKGHRRRSHCRPALLRPPVQPALPGAYLPHHRSADRSHCLAHAPAATSATRHRPPVRGLLPAGRTDVATRPPDAGLPACLPLDRSPSAGTASAFRHRSHPDPRQTGECPPAFAPHHMVAPPVVGPSCCPPCGPDTSTTNSGGH